MYKSVTTQVELVKVKSCQMWEIPNTRNIFRVEQRTENKKPVYCCMYRIGHDLKKQKIYDKEEAFNIVIKRYEEYLNFISNEPQRTIYIDREGWF